MFWAKQKQYTLYTVWRQPTQALSLMVHKSVFA